MRKSAAWYLWLLLVLVCSSGASCRQWRQRNQPLAPVAFSGPPTLEDILYTVNANSSRIRQLSAQSASLTTSEAPISLRASLDIERPLRIRLRGRVISDELDIGSNDELLWFWAKSDPEHAIYYAFHEQFVQSATNQVLPIGPDWLIESLGLVNLDPAAVHNGPTLRPDGSIELRSRYDRHGAALNRVLVIDSKYGWIKEQHILDLAGRPLAIARTSNHRFYPEAGASLPHRIHIELPPAKLTFQLEVQRFTINQLLGDRDQLFTQPSYEGYRLVNLAEPQSWVGQPNQGQPSAYAPQSQGFPHTAYRYRGFSEAGDNR